MPSDRICPWAWGRVSFPGALCGRAGCTREQNWGSLCKAEGGSQFCLFALPALGAVKGETSSSDRVHRDPGDGCRPSVPGDPSVRVWREGGLLTTGCSRSPETLAGPRHGGSSSRHPPVQLPGVDLTYGIVAVADTGGQEHPCAGSSCLASACRGPGGLQALHLSMPRISPCVHRDLSQQHLTGLASPVRHPQPVGQHTEAERAVAASPGPLCCTAATAARRAHPSGVSCHFLSNDSVLVVASLFCLSPCRTRRLAESWGGWFAVLGPDRAGVSPGSLGFLTSAFWGSRGFGAGPRSVLAYRTFQRLEFFRVVDSGLSRILTFFPDWASWDLVGLVACLRLAKPLPWTP